MNTKIEYMYRDAGNYKFYREAVIDGLLKEEELRSFCFDGDLFIPDDVGLLPAEKDFADDEELDHPWHELLSVSPTEDASTVDMTAQELLAKFRTADIRGWNDTTVLGVSVLI